VGRELTVDRVDRAAACTTQFKDARDDSLHCSNCARNHLVGARAIMDALLLERSGLGDCQPLNPSYPHPHPTLDASVAFKLFISQQFTVVCAGRSALAVAAAAAALLNSLKLLALAPRNPALSVRCTQQTHGTRTDHHQFFVLSFVHCAFLQNCEHDGAAFRLSDILSLRLLR